MNRCDVRDPSVALAYLVDCTLATVSSHAMLKNRTKCEFDCQISIAQTGYDWMKSFGVDYHETRAKEVDKFEGSVRDWAAQYIR